MLVHFISWKHLVYADAITIEEQSSKSLLLMIRERRKRNETKRNENETVLCFCIGAAICIHTRPSCFIDGVIDDSCRSTFATKQKTAAPKSTTVDLCLWRVMRNKGDKVEREHMDWITQARGCQVNKNIVYRVTICMRACW